MTRRNLLSEVKDIPAAKARGPNWCERFAKSDDYYLVKMAVVDWLNGGRMAALFPSKASFHRYLSGKHARISCDPPVLPEISQATFRALVTFIEREHNGEEEKKPRKRGKRS